MNGVLPSGDRQGAQDGDLDKQDSGFGQLIATTFGTSMGNTTRHPKSAVANERIRNMFAQVTAAPTTTHNAMADFTHSRAFNVASMLAISLNSVYLGLETQLADPNVETQGVWLAIDLAFTVVFTVELVLRIWAERLPFFRDLWNLLDAFLVVVSLLDLGVIQQLSSSGAVDLDIINVMRVLRIMRLARVFKMLSFFKKLWLLSVGVVNAMRALFWAWILIAVLLYIFGILTTRTLGKVYGSADEDILEQFGSVPRSMFTMFQIMTLEGWSDIVRHAMAFEAWVVILFLLFMMATTYSIMNVIIAVIVESTLESATNQKAELVRHGELEARRAGKKIEEVFRATDTDGSGDVTKEEFLAAIERPEVKEYLKEAGVDVKQATNIFDILDYDESGTLSAEEFRSGVMRARGQASAKDVLALQCNVWRNSVRMRSDIEKVCQMVEGRMRKVDREVTNIRSTLRTISESIGSRPG